MACQQDHNISLIAFTNIPSVPMALVKPSKVKQEPSTNAGGNVPAQNRIVVEKSLETRTYCNYWLAIAFVLIY